MEITIKYHKRKTIYKWKSKGVVYHDFDDLYETYIKTMNCGHCGKEFPNTIDRQLDHDHETGQFRKIVCKNCNNRDSYINYPAGIPSKKERHKITRDKYKDKYYEKAKEKYTCECGSILRRNDKARHERSKKHARFMEQLD